MVAWRKGKIRRLRKWGVLVLLAGALAALTSRCADDIRQLLLPDDAAATAAAAAALRRCTSLECVRRVHAMPGRRQFEFPHFMMIGWEKCGTTSLYEHLVRQPQVLRPAAKEPDYFAQYCVATQRCRTTWSTEPAYVRELLGAANASADTWRHPAFDASTSYARFGARVAPAVRAALPWVRILASLREPVSHAISRQQHLHDRLVVLRVNDSTGEACLPAAGDVFPCLKRTLQQRNYSVGLAEWLRAFPAQQLFIVQFEQLTGDGQAGVLRDLHAFLGLDPPVARRLPHRNNRKKRKPKGWQLRREQYEQLVDLARRDAHEVVELLSKAGLADGAAWLAEWERVWKANLESCDAAGQCHIQVT